MVRGLIQKQKRGADEEGASEGDAHAPPSRECLRLPSLHHGREPEPVQHLRRLPLRGVRSLVPQRVVHLDEARVGCVEIDELAILIHRRFIIAGGPLSQLLFFLTQLHELHISLHHGLNGGAVIPDNLLFHQQHVDVFGDRDLPPCQQPKQGGLALSVRTDEPIPPPVHHIEGRVLHQLLPLCHHGETFHLNVTRHVVGEIHLLDLLRQTHCECIILVAHGGLLLGRDLRGDDHLLLLLLLRVLVGLHFGKIDVDLALFAHHLLFIVR
mmetsp:Transcript_20760/g.34737  ORF Transcript_20760/g.34737 Transcript_20760/m.34737 type:complete len:268 (+) Transcript_20760:1259-2062(+)